MSLPPLTALRAFAALAETGSVVTAGERLNVSHAAISQQIKALETHMGIPLVDRTGRQLQITAEGQQLAEVLNEGFDAIARCVATLTGADADRPLSISTTQMFATTWLMPRLSQFQERHPGVDIMINPSALLSDPAPGGIDVALRFGSGRWSGLDAEMLVATNMTVAAAPSLVGDRQFTHASELLDYPWLQELETNEAQDWLRTHGVPEGKVKSVMQMPGNLTLDAARAGQGIIILAMSTIQPDVDAGRLRVLFRDEGETGYHIVTRPGILRPQARTFVQWLRRQK